MNGVIYKRELNHSYMVIRSDTCNITENYAYRMMTQNHIGRLLECSQRYLDGEPFLYYDISSRQPLERLYESRKLDVEALRRILYEVSAVQQDLGEYLMDEQGLMLEPEMIFANVETEELYFCFNPEPRRAEGHYVRLADFFLGHVDHGEEHAVNIAYQFYQMSKAEYFVLSAFLPTLEKEAAAWKAAKDGVKGIGTWEDTAAGQEAVQDMLWEDLQEAEETEAEASKKSWIERIFSRKRKNDSDRRKRKGIFGRKDPALKEAEESAVGKEEWPETVWSSYAGQEASIQSGETVYFADLNRPSKKPQGVPCLTEEDGERQFLLKDLPVTVGKLKGKVTVVLSDSSVSRMHARFEDGEEGICVQDLNSRNGTLVNGKKLAPNESVQLAPGDLIQFGRERFLYGFIDSKVLK